MTVYCVFFFNDTATTEIYTLSLHDALPICKALRPLHRIEYREPARDRARQPVAARPDHSGENLGYRGQDRKSTRLNSSHANISYAVFCLKKKKIQHLDCGHHRIAHSRSLLP